VPTSSALIQLYVVGVFIAFTLSQAGMVRYWRRTRGRELGEGEAGGGGWRRAMAVNALGAVATGVVSVVVVATKFLHGAWVVVVAMPLLVLVLHRLGRHGQMIERRLRRGAVRATAAPVHTTVVVYVEQIDAATEEALGYVRLLRSDAVHAIHPAGGGAQELRRAWVERLGDPLELVQLEAADGPVAAVIDHLRALERPDSEHFLTVVVPELMRTASTAEALRHRAVLQLKLRLLAEPGAVVTDIPVLQEPGAEPDARRSIRP
jgi:hypothetical protein